jgi:uncharacterized repeat protein (TIGR04138 family)
MKQELDNLINQICETDGRYQPEVYTFILDALAFAQKKFRKQKHVTGQELLEAIKMLLIENYGPMTMTVLNHWGIRETEDFGNIVFNMVNRKILSKTDDDTLESFKKVFDFEAEFNHAYRNRLAKKISRLR